MVAIFFAPEGIPPWSGEYDLRFWLIAAPVGAATWCAAAKVLVRAAPQEPLEGQFIRSGADPFPFQPCKLPPTIVES